MSGAQNRDNFTGGRLSTIGRRGDVEDTRSLCAASLDVRPRLSFSAEVRNGLRSTSVDNHHRRRRIRLRSELIRPM